MVFVTLKGTAAWPRPSVVDYIHDGRGVYGKQTVDELKAEYPDGEVLPELEGHAKYEAAFVTGPKRIDEKRFWYLLEVLPPCRWTRWSVSESFHVSEAVAGNIVTWAVRIGERHVNPRYYELDRPATTTHAELVKLCS